MGSWVVVHRPHLDGLRGLAVLLVVAYHFWPSAVPGGFLGVSLFFTLSGYLVTNKVVTEVVAGKFSVRHFMTGRIRRLLPAATVVLLTCVVFGLAHGWEVWSAQTWWANIYYQTRPTGYDSPSESAVRHFWSLSLEEWFVLILLPVALLVRGRQSPRRTVLIGSLVTFTASTTLRFTLLTDSGHYYNGAVRLGEMAVGAALSCLPPTASLRFDRIRAVSVAPFIVCLAAVSYTFARWSSVTLASALLAAVMIAERCAVLEEPVFRWLGKISYSLYLVHWPIVVVTSSTVLRVIGSLGLAIALHYGVEQRMRYHVK